MTGAVRHYNNAAKQLHTTTGSRNTERRGQAGSSHSGKQQGFKTPGAKRAL